MRPLRVEEVTLRGPEPGHIIRGKGRTGWVARRDRNGYKFKTETIQKAEQDDESMYKLDRVTSGQRHNIRKKRKVKR
jgi:hypothetical protein